MTIRPSDLEEFAAQGFNRVPLVRGALADLDTPLSTYLKLARGPCSYLFESVEGGEKWGRYSIIGLPARTVLSVTGDTLTEIYLGHRQVLELEERGGARARVVAVEVLEVSSIEPESDGGFIAEAAWTVGGSVTHFGHRHFRENRFDARVAVVAEQDTWKIRAIEVLNEERLR